MSTEKRLEIPSLDDVMKFTLKENTRLKQDNKILKKAVDMDLIKERYSTLIDVSETAKQCGVFSAFVELKDAKDEKYNGTYFVVCPDFETLRVLQYNMTHLEELLEKDDKRPEQMMNCYYNFVRLNDVNDDNYYDKHQSMCIAVQRMAVAAHSFYEFGFRLPSQMHINDINNIFDFNNKRADYGLPEALREDYEKAFKALVKDCHNYYEKLDRQEKVQETQIGKNAVDKDWFFKHHISVINESVDKRFFDFIKTKFKDHPEFKYYRSLLPEIKTKDLSNISDEMRMILNGRNPWANRTSVERYAMTFARDSAKLYYSWMVEYNNRAYDHVPIDDIRSSTRDMQTTYIKQDVMYNWNNLTKCNHVKYAIDFNAVDDNPDPVVIRYRVEDAEMVGAILSRLASEQRNWSPTNSRQKALSNEHRPSEKKDNVWLPDYTYNSIGKANIEI